MLWGGGADRCPYACSCAVTPSVDSLTSPELIKTRKRAAESPPTKAAKAMKLGM